MRLLFLNHNVAWSGTFFRAYHLGRHLAAMGHHVTLVTTHVSNRMRLTTTCKDGMNIVYAPDLLWGPARQGWDPVNVLRRSWHLRQLCWDLVHAFDSRPVVLVPALQALRRGSTLVMDWADWWGRGGTIQERSSWLVRTFFGPIETWFEEAFRGAAQGTTVISSALASRARSLGVDPDTMLHIPHGCDVSGFAVMDRGHARSLLGLVPEDRLLIHLGRPLPGDATLLFDALRRLREWDPRIRLVLVGKPQVPISQDLVRSDAVVQTGFVSYQLLQTWLGAADLAVVPLQDTIANRGRWPSKVNDYFAAGRAVVITRVGDAATVVERAQAGWVASPDAAQFAETLALALDNDGAREAAGQRARALAETELAWTRLAATLADFYVRISNRQPRAAASSARTAGMPGELIS